MNRRPHTLLGLARFTQYLGVLGQCSSSAAPTSGRRRAFVPLRPVFVRLRFDERKATAEQAYVQSLFSSLPAWGGVWLLAVAAGTGREEERILERTPS